MRKIMIAAAAALLASTAACNTDTQTNTSNTVITDYNASDGTVDEEIRQEEVTVEQN